MNCELIKRGYALVDRNRGRQIEANGDPEDVARCGCVREYCCRIEVLVYVDDILTSFAHCLNLSHSVAGAPISSNTDGFYELVDKHEDIPAIALGAETGTAAAKTYG